MRKSVNLQITFHVSRFTLFALLLTLFLVQLANASAAENVANHDSIHYLIEGVYYLIDQNQPERAVPYFERAIALDSSQPDAYYFLGVSYYQLRQPIGHTLFYLQEAEKRGVQYDRFRPDLLSEIQRQYPDVQPSQTRPVLGEVKEARIVVESEDERGGTISIQPQEGRIQKFKLGEPIPLAGGKRYQIRFIPKPKHRFFKRLALVASVIGIWLLR
jgi:tetratricopeptide (TPR) repeat protein